MIDYFQIIHKYIPPDSSVYRVYLPHVTLVTAKALRIAQHLGLSREQQRFIEEAAMLHDIGIVKVTPFSPPTEEQRPYICHAPLGRGLLEAEGLPRHALVAERHIGVGITKTEIEEQRLPLPARDMLPETQEERIIGWADLFYSKKPHRLWEEASYKHIERGLAKFGARQPEAFRQWSREFGCGEFARSHGAGE